MIDWKSHQTCAAICLRVCGHEGWPTTLSSEQHDWMKLSHESPELKRKSRSGIPTLRNLVPERAFSIAPWYYPTLSPDFCQRFPRMEHLNRLLLRSLSQRINHRVARDPNDSAKGPVKFEDQEDGACHRDGRNHQRKVGGGIGCESRLKLRKITTSHETTITSIRLETDGVDWTISSARSCASSITIDIACALRARCASSFAGIAWIAK
jgi:hypothetical protein